MTNPTADDMTAVGSNVTYLPQEYIDSSVDRYRLAVLSFAHVLTDSYGSALLSPLFPILAERLHLSYMMVGALPMVIGITASLGQPVVGIFSDRLPYLPLVAIGPAVAALFCGMVGFAHSYTHLLCFLFLAGIGIGAFHPQGARLARDAGRGSGLAMSGFTVGGNVGYGLSPLLGALYLRYFGLEGWFVSAFPGVLLAVALGFAFHRAYTQSRENGPPPRSANGNNPRALTYLTLSVMLRAVVPIGMTAYLPFHVQRHSLPGIDPHAAKAIAVSALLLASALAGPFGGHLSDRIGRRRVMIASFLFASWPLLASFYLPGYLGLASLVTGGFILMLPHPSNVVMAQEFMPQSAGVAASMITGVAWGLATLLMIPLGAMADHVGVTEMLKALCLIPLLGAVVVLPIPERMDE